MTSEILFNILLGILIISFMIEKLLEAANAKHFNDPIPAPLQDVYDAEEYERSQRYKREKYRFGLLSSSFTLLLTLAFLWFDGFALVDQWARSISDHPIGIALIFFGIIIMASDILAIPFSYYHTFVIEEKYGFNKSTLRLFFLDKVKGWGMMIVMGGAILTAVVWFYEISGSNFWWYAWILITIFTLFMNLFYARLIVPLFNKQSPLPDNELRSAIETYSKQVGFQLDKIFVIDGSKRSTKANAYFSGFGKEKRITLYDTLIKDLDESEIVAVLAHEIGHYKKHHIIANLVVSLLTTGFMLWLLSLFVDSDSLSQSLGVAEASFHVGLIAFGILYSPISAIINLLMNYLSRVFEYQADDFAEKTYHAGPLISALKKLSKNNLSNLTPHPAYVAAHYSHPTLLQRIKNLSN